MIEFMFGASNPQPVLNASLAVSILEDRITPADAFQSIDDVKALTNKSDDAKAILEAAERDGVKVEKSTDTGFARGS
jgi:hypothetical protein